jgi:hypothetical protein
MALQVLKVTVKLVFLNILVINVVSFPTFLMWHIFILVYRNNDFLEMGWYMVVLQVGQEVLLDTILWNIFKSCCLAMESRL